MERPLQHSQLSTHFPKILLRDDTGSISPLILP